MTKKTNYTLLLGIKIYVPVVEIAVQYIGHCLTGKGFFPRENLQIIKNM